MVTGTNGSQLWDLAFTMQALVETGLADDKANRESVLKGLGWLDRCQIRDNPPVRSSLLHLKPRKVRSRIDVQFYESAHRQTTKGAWPFSTKEQGYTVSDCTAEALKAVLYLQKDLEYVPPPSVPSYLRSLTVDRSYTPEAVNEERMHQAIDVILSLQNPGGGFASYELIRGGEWLEWLNPAEVFNNIMIECVVVVARSADSKRLMRAIDGVQVRVSGVHDGVLDGHVAVPTLLPRLPKNGHRVRGTLAQSTIVLIQ